MVEIENIEELIGIYLSGEATPEQAIKLDKWKEISPENAQTFDELSKVYSTTHGNQSFSNPDKKLAWNNIANVMDETKIIPLWKRKSFWTTAASIAAVLTLIFYVFSPANNSIDPIIAEQQEKDTLVNKNQSRIFLAENGTKNIDLDDLSKVRLYQNSSLEIDKEFGVSNRTVTLNGSGKFEVIHDETKPFKIVMNELEILDIGTVFSVTSDNDTIKIAVQEGEVQLSVNSDEINVLAGDSAYYVISKQLIETYKNKSIRKDKVFEFDGTSLQEVTTVLSEFFDKEIIISNEELKNCPVSVTFKNEELVTILDIITELLDIKMKRNETNIELYGEACN